MSGTPETQAQGTQDEESSPIAKDYQERVVQSVAIPTNKKLTSSELFVNKASETSETGETSGSNEPKGVSVNIEKLKEHLSLEGRLENTAALMLIKSATQLFREEPNVLQLKDPINVCGDIHGQYYDLLKLLEIGGEPADCSYLFLGDYVDRGMFGCEVCFLMFAYKINYPETFSMIRGNHECRHLTAFFNFKVECLYKYNAEIYDAFMEAFDCLPVAAILNNRFLCVHGGISPEIKSVEEIEELDRFREIPSTGALCDLMWSDPMENEDEDNNPNSTFMMNETRGCSYVYSYNAVSAFLKANRLLSIIRAHEAQDEGYRLYKAGAVTKFPTVICIFSAPNYCDVYGNKGALIRLQNNISLNIRQFNASPHPYYLPNFMNAFNWSMPFVVEKVMDMFNVILTLCDPADDDEDDKEGDSSAPIDKERAESIRMKIRTLGRVCRMYSTLRQEHEAIVQLKGLAGGQLPQGILSQGPDAIRKHVLDFKSAKYLDKQNEKRPSGDPQEPVSPRPSSRPATPHSPILPLPFDPVAIDIKVEAEQ